MQRNFYRVNEASHFKDWQSTDSSWLIKDPEETIALGKVFSQKIPNLKLLLLEGPLGAGKTSLVKGIAINMGIYEPITSPTFPLAQHYPATNPSLFHLDLYRLEDPLAADELFIQEEEEAKAIDALMVIEWPERLRLHLPEAWTVKLQHWHDGSRLAQVLPPCHQGRNPMTSS